MSVAVTPIAEDFAVAPQLQPNDLDEIAHQGFRSVINNRPDGEGGPDQPPSESLRIAAQAVGQRYVFLPVAPSFFDADSVERMRRLLDELPKPILAFCRTGTRSTKLYRQAKFGSADLS